MQVQYSLHKTDLGPPEMLDVASLPIPAPLEMTRHSRSSVLITLSYGAIDQQFNVNYRTDWSERNFQLAITTAKLIKNALPLIVLPYLSEERLITLEREQISGLDLCGNGLIIVPGQWLVRSTGQPNRFRIEQSLRNAFAGKASLVGRVLLREPIFRRLEDLQREIERRGGQLSQALVSRTVARLEQEVIVGPDSGNRVRLLQADRLLDQLARAWTARRSKVIWRGRISMPTAEFLPKLFEAAANQQIQSIMTGLGSASHYTGISMEDTVYIYTDQPEALLRGLPTTVDERFANLELRQAPDSSVYFDADIDQRSIRWASPVQTCLEMLSGDARLYDSAQPLRERLIREGQTMREVLV
jgi:hypothetical protein